MTTNFIVSIIILFVRRWKGSLILIDSSLSLVTLIFLSISSTCSLVAVGLVLIYGNSGIRQSKYLYISAFLILNPLLLQILMTFLSKLPYLSLVRLGGYLRVVNLIFRDVLKNNPIPVTNITSTSRVTSFFRSSMRGGISI